MKTKKNPVSDGLKPLRNDSLLSEKGRLKKSRGYPKGYKCGAAMHGTV